MKRGLAFVGALAPLALLACKGAGAGAEAGDTKTSMPYTNESWCPDGFESGPSDTCFLIPEHPTKETPILVYLHGVFQRKGSPEEWQAVRVAAQRGFAVVIPRGKRALCAWRTEVKDQYCWPQDPDDGPTIKSLIAEWDRVLWQVDAVLEGGTHKRYVLGTGDGGSFAALIATGGFFPGQAYAAVGGGALAPPRKGKPVPMLLLGSQDDAERAPKTKELHEALSKASWPHALCPRSGPATLTTDDVDAAVRFFKHDADGTLKPAGATYPCEPKR
jgi:poly(3-hydroxybutyrate) depolymerase